MAPYRDFIHFKCICTFPEQVLVASVWNFCESDRVAVALSDTLIPFALQAVETTVVQ